MEEQLQAISDQQKDTWNKFSGGWKKWNDFNMDFLKPMGDAIIKELSIQSNDVVLDVASGTGEPAFTIAKMVKQGEVYATDVSDKMLEVAREFADEHDIENIEFKVADISDLPFEDDFFDKISCRMGFMFFPDVQLAANEMFRVCKNGGKIATSVWGSPEHNEWTSLMMKTLSENIEIPQPPPDAPSMFRCAKPGYIKELFEKAGFKNIREEIINNKIDFGSADNYWQMMTEVAAPVVGALGKADEATRSKIKHELFEKLKSKFDNGKLNLEYMAVIISGEK